VVPALAEFGESLVALGISSTLQVPVMAQLWLEGVTLGKE